MGIVRFGAPQEMVLWARDAFGIKNFVETGTNRAETTVWAAQHFPKVITIEGLESLYNEAVAKHGQLAQIEFLLGDSRTLLKPVLDRIGGPAILWLDAHWCGDGTFGPTSECPLLEELDAVNKSHPEHVILIDDARLFATPQAAPYTHDDWPSLLDITTKLTQGPVPRYAVIFEDVIAVVPASGRKALRQFVQNVLARPVVDNRSLARRVAGRIRGEMARRLFSPKSTGSS